MLLDLALVLASYLLGCLNTGYYLVRWRAKLDIRTRGSGTAGTLNVRRELGLPGALLTLTGDIARGVLTIWIGQSLGVGVAVLTLMMLAVVAGHIWPVQLRFRGGKGAAVAGGTTIALYTPFALAFVMVFVLVYAVVRSFTPSGLLVVALSPLIALAVGSPSVYALQVTALALLVGWAHRSNVIESLSARDASRSEH